MYTRKCQRTIITMTNKLTDTVLTHIDRLEIKAILCFVI